jgi:hypothetical protein
VDQTVEMAVILIPAQEVRVKVGLRVSLAMPLEPFIQVAAEVALTTIPHGPDHPEAMGAVMVVRLMP